MEFVISFGIASLLVFGVSANERMEQGLPVLPKFTGFRPMGLLPEGEHTEEVYYPDIDPMTAHPAHVQTVSDPHVDSYVQEWVDAYESEGTGDQVGGYADSRAPEALKNNGSETGSILETIPETTDLSSNISGRDFHQNAEIFPVSLPDMSDEGPFFAFEADEFDEDEYAVFCDLVNLDGLNPKGREIVYVLWGIKPGRHYSKAMNKRNMYADRKKSA